MLKTIAPSSAGPAAFDNNLTMVNFDISDPELRGQDLYLWTCGGCGQQTLAGHCGGDLVACGCEGMRPMTVTAIRQQSRHEAREFVDAHMRPIIEAQLAKHAAA